MPSDNEEGDGKKSRGRPRKRGKLTGTLRLRSVEKYGYEAAIDYLLELLKVRGEERLLYTDSTD